MAIGDTKLRKVPTSSLELGRLEQKPQAIIGGFPARTPQEGGNGFLSNLTGAFTDFFGKIGTNLADMNADQRNEFSRIFAGAAQSVTANVPSSAIFQFAGQLKTGAEAALFKLALDSPTGEAPTGLSVEQLTTLEGIKQAREAGQINQDLAKANIARIENEIAQSISPYDKFQLDLQKIAFQGDINSQQSINQIMLSSKARLNEIETEAKLASGFRLKSLENDRFRIETSLLQTIQTAVDEAAFFAGVDARQLFSQRVSAFIDAGILPESYRALTTPTPPPTAGGDVKDPIALALEEAQKGETLNIPIEVKDEPG